jgi:hypothetical protein
MARASMAEKTSEKPQLIHAVAIAKAATKATAPRADDGMRARRSMARRTGRAVATT